MRSHLCLPSSHSAFLSQPLTAAVEHGEAALRLAWEEAQRVEAGECLARLLAALGRHEEAAAHAQGASPQP